MGFTQPIASEEIQSFSKYEQLEGYLGMYFPVKIGFKSSWLHLTSTILLPFLDTNICIRSVTLLVEI